MRKLLLFTIAWYSCNYVFAQNPDDVVRNAWFIPNGTARSISVGGATGALGGDITAAYTNPAGLGFYKTREIVITPSFLLNNNKSDYRGTASSGINSSAFQLGTAGVVIGGKPTSVNNTSTFSVSINQLAGYNNKISYSGFNNYSSYSEQYLEQLVANNATINQASNDYPFGASLAFFTYLIDSVSNVNGELTGYRSLVPLNPGVRQQYDEVNKGGLYEISVGFASNNKDKVLFGGSINVPVSFYKKDITYTESDAGTDANNNFSNSVFTQTQTINGIGINGRIGVIYKPLNSLRLGLAFHTPSYMSISDKLTAQITTNTEAYKGIVTSKSSDFPNATNQVQYNQITPYKFIASAAYVFREVENVKLQKGFISADIEYVNHRGSRFSQQNSNGTSDPATDSYYNNLNDVIKSYYKGALNVKLGGEIKLSPFAVRLGGAYYGSPYSDKTLKASRILLAGGVGYRNYGMFVDLTLAQTINKDVSFPYRLSDKANTFATLKNQRTNVILTVGFKF